MQNDFKLEPELKAMLDGYNIALVTFISALAKQPGIDIARLLSDWEATIKKLQTQPPTFAPTAFVIAAQFEEVIRRELPPSN